MKAVVLGNIQDGGLPHPLCTCKQCEAARESSDHLYRSSLGIWNPETNKTFILDASPDLPQQLQLLKNHTEQKNTDGRTLADGILLTHAHTGHYMGLWYAGKEALGAQAQPVYCTDTMHNFLCANQPWANMLENGYLQIRTVIPGEAFPLDRHLTALPIEVPHRNEHSDTVAYVVRSPHRALLYLPDLDSWQSFERQFNSLMSEVDLAFIDGTFFSEEELPEKTARGFDEVPHPPMTQTAALFDKGKIDRYDAELYFIHLNHTNPMLNPNCRHSKWLKRSPLKLARQSQEFELL